MRAWLLVLLLLMAAGASGALGCSGASADPPPPPSSDLDPSEPPLRSGESPPANPVDGGNAPADASRDATTSAGGGKKCVGGSAVEIEANDTPETANAIAAENGSYCGTLTASDDVDFVTFTLPANAKYVGLGSDFTKVGVEVDVIVAGKTFDITATPFEPGEKYVVKMRTTGKAPVDYRLDVEIQK